MPKHKPIRFEEPELGGVLKSRIKLFLDQHPIAKSAGRVVLALAALGGALTVATVAPGLVGALNRMNARERREKRERYDDLWRSFYHLKKSRALEYVGEKNGELIYRLASGGKTKLKSFLLETLEIEAPRRWDRKWRVIVFDIPEKYRGARKALYNKMVEIGLYPMQKSVLVHPFPCEHEIEFLKDFFNVKPYVDILLVSEMPNGRVLYYFKDLVKEYL